MSEVQGEFRRGWKTILAAAAGASIGLTGIIFYSFGLFIKPLSAEFGWTRGDISLGMTWITLGTVITGPFIGILTDKYGVKKVAVPSMLGLALALCFMSTVHPPIMTFYLGCLAIALLGCATTPLTWTKAVSMSFQKNRGLALGLTLLGGAAASLIGAPLLQKMIVSDGWRPAYLATAAFTALIALPIVLLFLKEPKRTADEHAAANALLTGRTFKEAVRTAPFWLLGFGILALITAQSAVTIHMVPLLTDRGVDPGDAARIAGFMGLSIVVGRLGVGALLDRFNPPLVAGVVLSLPVLAVIVLALCGNSQAAMIGAIILLGLSAGAEIDLLSFFIGRYFGLKSYGKIYGALFSMFSLGNGIGAPVLGASYDHFQSYVPGLWVAAVVFAIGAAMFTSLGFFKPVEGVGAH